jgi:hypothetical protein
MKTFLLYGEQACRIYKEEGIERVSSTRGEIDIFDTEKIDIINTLSNFSGWGDVVVITESEYNLLFEHWYK